MNLATINTIMTYVLLACLIAAIGATIYIAVTPHVGERFTEFYILGPSGKAYGYPTNLTLGESGTVIIGVVNHEYEEVSYRIVILLGNETIAVIDDIRLKHNEAWHQNYTFTPKKAGDRMKLEFLLYREGIEKPYRTLHLWVTVHPRRGG
ncbi:MAG: DUF1616 domain-containing protein [Nitrososphaerota archaeon]|nr:DUF1616 domain-containing protein [Candidatus Nezhaarchaeota archaeon]MDW8050000.1 DUF1616 domain-containing protein [Nitrososphaerota archaeon]